MLSNITDWSSRLAAQAAQAAKKGTADALQLAARKLGDISESLHDVDLSADEQYELCQLIDGDGACQDLSLHHFFEMLGVSKQTPYMIISIMGSQSGGKSTLLNHMFGTKFKEMDPNPSLFGQNTVGMWIGKSLKQKGTTVFVIDNEGCDSRERADDKMQNLERRFGLMALRASDILILNLSCGAAGQDHGANLTLIKTMIEAKLQQLAKTVRSLGSDAPMVKSTLVVVLRDMMKPIDKNLPPYRDIFLRNLRSTFANATKPKELGSPTFEECFQVFVTGLPDFRYDRRDFAKACKELRHRITYTTDHTPEHPKYGDYVPIVRNEHSMPANILPEQFASMWDGIANDPNLDWHDSEVAIFQNFCARLKSEVFESVVGGSAWAALKGQCAELIPDLQKRMCVIMAEAISDYDSAFEEMVCRDGKYKQSQKVELSTILAEKMKDDFYKPTLTQIADKLWQAGLPRMSAASTRVAKKSVFDGISKQFAVQAAPQQLSHSRVADILVSSDTENEGREEGIDEGLLKFYAAHRSACDWSSIVKVEEKALQKRFMDKFGSEEEKKQANNAYEDAQNEEAKKSTAYRASIYLLNMSIDGIEGILDGAQQLAHSYKSVSYHDNDARVTSLIRYECAKAAAGGFVTGLGGVLTMPITIPADLLGNWLLQGRLVATIALIYGHDVYDDRVRTWVLLTVMGSSMTDIARECGVAIGEKVAMNALKQVPGKTLIAINKAVGFRLITKAGKTGVVNLIKWIPFVGGIVGGSVNAVGANSVGTLAMKNFKQ